MIHCTHRVLLRCLISILLVSFQIGCAAHKRIGKFDYPTGAYKAADYERYAGWLDGCDGTHASNRRCHLGIDIRADEGDEVYPISHGRIVAISSSGWNCRGSSGNVGVVVKHELEDGTEFLALYGHVRTKRTVNDDVFPGQSFATVGPWCRGNHLHFGIHPGLTMPASNWGSLPCGKCADNHNGFVDPLEFINKHRPASEN
jgi:murein DD-endopeptidase MepM/ murein hydrolase activator NlpD